MNIENQKKISQYLTAVCDGKSFDLYDALDEAIRKHADGTPCKAKSPDSCPFNQKAEAGEHLEGTEKKDGKEETQEEFDYDSFLESIVDEVRGVSDIPESEFVKFCNGVRETELPDREECISELQDLADEYSDADALRREAEEAYVWRRGHSY